MDAQNWRGISDLVRSLTREQFYSLWNQNMQAQTQAIMAQVSSSTMQAQPMLGGIDPAAIDRTADEGSSGSGARADHVHALDLTGGEAITITGAGTAFVADWDGILVGANRALELAEGSNITIDVVDHVATISSSGGGGVSLGDKFGPPASGTDGFDLSGALWHKYDATWVQCTPGVAVNWGDGGADDILVAANWEGGALLAGYRTIEPGVGMWEYSTDGWVDLSEDSMPFSTVAAPPFSAARSKAGLIPLPAGYDWLLQDFEAVAEGSVGVWDASHRWDLSLCQNGTTYSTLQQTTQAEAVHGDAISDVVAGGLALALKCVPVGRPGLLTRVAATVQARRVRQV